MSAYQPDDQRVMAVAAPTKIVTNGLLPSNFLLIRQLLGSQTLQHLRGSAPVAATGRVEKLLELEHDTHTEPTLLEKSFLFPG